jgi:hypothetical protein
VAKSALGCAGGGNCGGRCGAFDTSGETTGFQSAGRVVVSTSAINAIVGSAIADGPVRYLDDKSPDEF